MTLCAICLGEATVTTVDASATDFGLPSGVIRGVDRIECACGEVSFSIAAHGAVIKEYRLQLARVDRSLTSDEFAYLRRSLRVSGQDYAEALAMSNVTISRLENGGSISGLQDAMIRTLTHLDVLTLDAIGELLRRGGTEVQVDAKSVEKSRARQVSGGWRTIKASVWPANVIPIGRFSRRSAAVITKKNLVPRDPIGLAESGAETGWMQQQCR